MEATEDEGATFPSWWKPERRLRWRRHRAGQARCQRSDSTARGSRSTVIPKIPVYTGTRSPDCAYRESDERSGVGTPVPAPEPPAPSVRSWARGFSAPCPHQYRGDLLRGHDRAWPHHRWGVARAGCGDRPGSHQRDRAPDAHRAHAAGNAAHARPLPLRPQRSLSVAHRAARARLRRVGVLVCRLRCPDRQRRELAVDGVRERSWSCPGDHPLARVEQSLAVGLLLFRTMRKTRDLALSVLLVLLAAIIATAGEPTDQVRRSVDEVIKVVQSQPDGPSRRAEVRRIANQLFDFEETARRALGQHWQRARPPSARCS